MMRERLLPVQCQCGGIIDQTDEGTWYHSSSGSPYLYCYDGQSDLRRAEP